MNDFPGTRGARGSASCRRAGIGLTTAVAALAAAQAPAAAASDLGSEKNPVILHPLPQAFTIDGDPAKWAAINALPAPFSRKDAGMLKLAWREDGIYGCLQATDAKVTIDAFNPWTRDCLELWLETDCARSYDMSDHSWQLALAPNPDAGPGRGVVIPAQGRLDKEKVEAAWRPATGGYVLEFHIPAAQLKTDMHEGLRIGMNYSVDDKGIAVEEFYSDKDMDSGFCSPCRWGVIELGK